MPLDLFLPAPLNEAKPAIQQELNNLHQIIGSRVFSERDQARFAAISGDFNPMHVDPISARRTGAGAPVVHGVHSLLWCLDCLAQVRLKSAPLSRLRVNFDTFVTINEHVDAVLVQLETNRARAEVRVDGVCALTVLLEFGGGSSVVSCEKTRDLFNPQTPIDLSVDETTGMTGTIAFATPPAALAAVFPHAAHMMGDRRIAAMGAFTRLIGMVCPGLHSIFNRLSLESSTDDGADDIGFQVTDVKHRRVLCSVFGGGWAGTLTSMMRHRPTAQPSMSEVAQHVRRGEFAQSISLIVGGSRGIGEVAAKIIAAGGGKPIITFATGERDARRVSEEIQGWGADCGIENLDINLPVPEQLTALRDKPNQLFYFATPMIGGRRTRLFAQDQLDKFVRYYVTGFYDCCCALSDSGKNLLTALYPSTVFLDDRPSGVTEYAMAKAAGEHLCRDMNSGIPNFRALVARLPRLATDQNPGLAEPSTGEAVSTVILPWIREMCEHPK